MINDDHRELREALGLYVLGRLPADEEVQVRAHLDGCRECRGQADELAPMPELLSRVDPERLSPQIAPSAGLGDRVLARVGAERARQARAPGRGLGRALVLAAVLVALVLGGGIGWAVKPAPAPPQTVSVELQQRPDVAAQGAAHLIDHGWGIEIVLTVEGLSSGEPYRVEVIDRDGRRTQAGGWLGVGAQRMECRLTAAVAMGETVSFEVLDADGRRVLWSTWG